MNHWILLVDDNEENIFSTRILLEMKKYRVDVETSGRAAIDRVRSKKREYALILMDYHMPEMDGAQTSREILSIAPKQQILMYSCDDTKETALEALRARMTDFLPKNTDPEVLLEKVEELCAHYEQTSCPIEHNSDPDEVERRARALGFVGRSESMGRVTQDVLRFGPQAQTVMIQGESGTGKELVASALHRQSSRKNGQFVAVNCGSIPENLVESTLFGHEKGSFTGALRNQLGKFALANHGTLFLDEIGEMPLSSQVKLLRVLQERVYEPVGSTRPVPVDVRIITATHQDLKTLVTRKLFREDLYYRLLVLEINLDPLRERRLDIEPLVAHFTALFNQANGTKKSFERATLSVLEAFSWPGNIRQLQNMVEKHLVCCDGDTVRVEDLDKALLAEKPIQSMDDFEKKQGAEKVRFIQKVVAQVGSKSKAAQILGVKPSALSYYF
jgi:DNA-binding NtrC family response regulator